MARKRFTPEQVISNGLTAPWSIEPPVPETRLPRSQDWILYPLEWTSDGPEANLKSGAGPGDRSMTNTGEHLELSAMTSLPNWQAT